MESSSTNSNSIENNIENTIIQSLLTNPIYFSKVFSHLKVEHFNNIENQEIYSSIKNYYSKYQDAPKPKEIGISLKDIKIEKLQKSTIEHFKAIMKNEKISNFDFLIDKSQEYVQKQEFVKAILGGAEAIQKNTDLAPVYGAIGDALKINFDADVGHNYNNINERLEYYKKKIFGLETGIKDLDDMLGGFRPKTLNVVASVSHGGKSLFMAHCAANLLLQGKKVLFLTLEMSELEVAKRIDANVLDIDINTFKSIDNDTFTNAYNSVKDSLGTLIIKEHPAGSFDVLKLESMMGELYNEEDFIPDIIFVDYLTLMKSTRVPATVGSYTLYKLISEELHGFAKKYNLPIVTAAQLNRSGYGNTSSGIESVADSLGIAMTADTFFSIIRNKEMDDLNQILITFQKNRNTGNMGNTIIGIDYPKMRYYSLTNTNNDTNNNNSLNNANNRFGVSNNLGSFGSGLGGLGGLGGLDGLDIEW
jgi:replicative DNA helicase